MKEKKQILIIDSNALIYRSYYGLPKLKNKRGEVINAIYGFCLILFKALKELNPDFIVSTFDLPFPTFRHKEYKEYKANRIKAPEELYQQIPKIKQLLEIFEIPIFEKKGFEADDIIGTISELTIKKEKQKIENIILSGDTDLFQLVSPQTKVYFLKNGGRNTYNEDMIKERYEGLLPKQLIDFKALKGDASDNITGVPGVGEKTALKLIKEFGNIEALYSSLDKLNGSLQKKLKENKDKAFLSRKLVEIKRDILIDFELEKCRWEEYNIEKAVGMLKNLGLIKLIEKLPKLSEGIREDKILSAKKVGEQKKLF
jgi:DNA polymerase-1